MNIVCKTLSNHQSYMYINFSMKFIKIIHMWKVYRYICNVHIKMLYSTFAHSLTRYLLQLNDAVLDTCIFVLFLYMKRKCKKNWSCTKRSNTYGFNNVNGLKNSYLVLSYHVRLLLLHYWTYVNWFRKKSFNKKVRQGEKCTDTSMPLPISDNNLSKAQTFSGSM